MTQLDQGNPESDSNTVCILLLLLGPAAGSWRRHHILVVGHWCHALFFSCRLLGKSVCILPYPLVRSEPPTCAVWPSCSRTFPCLYRILRMLQKYSPSPTDLIWIQNMTGCQQLWCHLVSALLSNVPAHTQAGSSESGISAYRL